VLPRSRGSFDRADSGGGHRGVFVFGSACPPLMMRQRGPSGDPAAPFARDEADDGLLHIGLNPFGGALFRVAADFADQMMACVSASSLKNWMESRKRSADDVDPAPMPMQVDWPMPSCVN